MAGRGWSGVLCYDGISFSRCIISCLERAVWFVAVVDVKVLGDLLIL